MAIFVLSSGLQASQRRALRVPNHPTEQNRGLWCPLQAVLFARSVLLQVLTRQKAAGLPVEQVLGEHSQ